jgi:hypothetical protein
VIFLEAIAIRPNGQLLQESDRLPPLAFAYFQAIATGCPGVTQPQRILFLMLDSISTVTDRGD